ncbi:hypothetical protein IscW_ISCW024632, partial [Ixodes scapularis]
MTGSSTTSIVMPTGLSTGTRNTPCSLCSSSRLSSTSTSWQSPTDSSFRSSWSCLVPLVWRLCSSPKRRLHVSGTYSSGLHSSPAGVLSSFSTLSSFTQESTALKQGRMSLTSSSRGPFPGRAMPSATPFGFRRPSTGRGLRSRDARAPLGPSLVSTEARPGSGSRKCACPEECRKLNSMYIVHLEQRTLSYYTDDFFKYLTKWACCLVAWSRLFLTIF